LAVAGGDRLARARGEETRVVTVPTVRLTRDARVVATTEERDGQRHRRERTHR
jgi:hypothetical protein